jgi:hypothetical protein
MISAALSISWKFVPSMVASMIGISPVRQSAICIGAVAL